MMHRILEVDPHHVATRWNVEHKTRSAKSEGMVMAAVQGHATSQPYLNNTLHPGPCPPCGETVPCRYSSQSTIRLF
jgi:hypothetical protein